MPPVTDGTDEFGTVLKTYQYRAQAVRIGRRHTAVCPTIYNSSLVTNPPSHPSQAEIAAREQMLDAVTEDAQWSWCPSHIGCSSKLDSRVVGGGAQSWASIALWIAYLAINAAGPFWAPEPPRLQSGPGFDRFCDRKYLISVSFSNARSGCRC